MERVARPLAVIALISLLALVAAAAPAVARPSKPPEVDVQAVAGMAPDARSMTVNVLASCPERWTVVEAVVTVSQPGAVGQAAFPLTCIGSLRSFWVSVPVSSGTFELEDAQVSASVVVERGKTAQASDSAVVPVQPLVDVALAESAQLESGGGAVVIDVTVACPAGTSGVESRLVVSQGQAIGVGLYTPVCDGAPHTFTVRVEASRGLYRSDFVAQALTFAQIDHAGQIFYGIDDDGSLELVG
ncbi:MAG: hypothetical protein ACRDQT_04785 [Gaiellaceae bacterium]